VPLINTRLNHISFVLFFSVDFRRMFLYKETLNRGHQANRRVQHRLKTHENDAQKTELLVVAGSLLARPFTVVCAKMREIWQAETGGLSNLGFFYFTAQPFFQLNRRS
jgi:hypothetical protein